MLIVLSMLFGTSLGARVRVVVDSPGHSRSKQIVVLSDDNQWEDWLLQLKQRLDIAPEIDIELRDISNSNATLVSEETQVSDLTLLLVNKVSSCGSQNVNCTGISYEEFQAWRREGARIPRLRVKRDPSHWHAPSDSAKMQFWEPFMYQRRARALKLFLDSDPASVAATFCRHFLCGAGDQEALKGILTKSIHRKQNEVNMHSDRAKPTLVEHHGDWTRVRFCVVLSRDISMGFFSNFMQAVDNLMSCERRGMNATIFWDPKYFNYARKNSSNAWTQFFEPVGDVKVLPRLKEEEYVVVNTFAVHPRIVPFQLEHFINSRSDNLHEKIMDVETRFRVHSVLQREVRVREPLQNFVDRFFDAYLKGHTVIGVHYRGNDHAEELPGGELIPLQLCISIVRGLLATIQNPKIFVATDTQSAVEAFIAEFGKDLVVSAAAKRSAVTGEGPSVHTSQHTSLLSDHANETHNMPLRSEDPSLGSEVLVDALLLARARHLVHSQSNVPAAALYWNPFLVSHYIGEREVFAFKHGAGADTDMRCAFDLYAEMNIRHALRWLANVSESLRVRGNATWQSCGHLRVYGSGTRYNLKRFKDILSVGSYHMRVWRLESTEPQQTRKLDTNQLFSIPSGTPSCPKLKGDMVDNMVDPEYFQQV